MGTTLVAAYLSEAGIAWISVGDSPLWLFRGRQLMRLNEDHSLRQMKREGARVSGNMLMSAVTGEPIPIVDCRPDPIEVRKGDLILLASDGVLTLSEPEIVSVLRANRTEAPEHISQSLPEGCAGSPATGPGQLHRDRGSGNSGAGPALSVLGCAWFALGPCFDDAET